MRGVDPAELLGDLIETAASCRHGMEGKWVHSWAAVREMDSILWRSLLLTEKKKKKRRRKRCGGVFVRQQREPNTLSVWTLRADWCNSRVDAHRSSMVPRLSVLLSSTPLYSFSASWQNMFPPPPFFFFFFAPSLGKIPVGGKRSRLYFCV